MKLEQFKKLLDIAQTDENGNLCVLENDYRKSLDMKLNKYDDDETEQKHYFAFIYTVCDDLIEEYCSKDNENNYELYDRHFTGNDDTLEAKIIRED